MKGLKTLRTVTLIQTAETVRPTCSTFAELSRSILRIQHKVIPHITLQTVCRHGRIAYYAIAEITLNALIGAHRVVVKGIKTAVALDAFALVQRVANHAVFCLTADTIALLESVV